LNPISSQYVSLPVAERQQILRVGDGLAVLPRLPFLRVHVHDHADVLALAVLAGHEIIAGETIPLRFVGGEIFPFALDVEREREVAGLVPRRTGEHIDCTLCDAIRGHLPERG
jgi:hypothetical protein